MPIDRYGQYIREEDEPQPPRPTPVIPPANHTHYSPPANNYPDTPPATRQTEYSPSRRNYTYRSPSSGAWWKTGAAIIGILFLIGLCSQPSKQNRANNIESGQQQAQSSPTNSSTSTYSSTADSNVATDTSNGEEPYKEETGQTSQDISEAETKVREFLSNWEQKDIRSVEFLLHNEFIGEGGINKWKWLALRKAEASRTQNRQIIANDMHTEIKGNIATVTFTQTYADEFYDGQKYSSDLKVHIELIKWSDQQWYLFKLRYSQP